MTDLDWLPGDETPLLDAALAYASHGFRVHPVWGVHPDGRCQCGKSACRYPDNKSAGKHPIAGRWQKLSTSDVDEVRDARSKRPKANIGLSLGGSERLVAVDIDGPQGRDSWAKITEGQPDPATLAQRTGRPDGGEQRIYTLAKRHDMKRLGNRAGFVFPGIDTRIDNGQVVVAPSVHGSGQRYTWISRIPIAEMPDWLFEALAGKPPSSAPAPVAPRPSPSGLDPYLARVLEHAAQDVASCREGGRNQILFAKSCTVFEYFIGEKLDHLEAWRVMNDAGRACGLPAGEVSSTLSKAWRKAQSSPPRTIPEAKRPEAPSPSTGLVPVTSSATQPTTYPATWDEPPKQEDRSWEEGIRNHEGTIKNTFGTVLTILRRAPIFAGRFSYDEMRITSLVDGAPLKDADISKVREEIEKGWGISPSKESATDAIVAVAAERSFHPVKRYLTELAWDGVSRIARIIPEVFGGDAADSLSQRMIRAWFVSAAARGLSPGCKVDTALVLYGHQGFRKSTFFEVLGGEWYSNSYVNISEKDGVLQVHAGWIYEWPEIERITTRRDADAAKAFITIARDNVRPPYGRGVVNQPRSGVIVGTTNKRFLDDETGARRFWPITMHRRLSDEGLDWLRTWRDQLWAEAVAAYKNGETWWLTEAEDRQREAAAQEFLVEDEWVGMLANYLATERNRGCKELTTGQVLRFVIGFAPDRIDRHQESRAGKALRALGWAPRQVRRNGAVLRVYQPTSDVVTVVTEKNSTISPMSQLSQPSQLDIEKKPEIEIDPLWVKSPQVGCDVVTVKTTTDNHLRNSSQPPRSDECCDGYPPSWDEVT